MTNEEHRIYLVKIPDLKIIICLWAFIAETKGLHRMPNFKIMFKNNIPSLAKYLLKYLLKFKIGHPMECLSGDLNSRPPE